MYMCLLTLKFQLHGCDSLKDKRQRLRGLKDKFGRTANLAICESGALDSKREAEFSACCLANDKSTINGILEDVLQHCRTSIDAELVHDTREWL